MNKSELLDALQRQDQEWQTLIDQIGTARMEQPGVNGDWSIKDIVAHLTGWNIKLVNDLQAALSGEPAPPPPWPAQLQTEDEINAWIFETNRGRSLRIVLDESNRVYQQILTIVQGLPKDAKLDPHLRGERVFLLVWVGDKYFPVGEFFDHFHDDHEPDVRAWLARAENH